MDSIRLYMLCPSAPAGGKSLQGDTRLFVPVLYVHVVIPFHFAETDTNNYS
jgi:hypothetical protein